VAGDRISSVVGFLTDAAVESPPGGQVTGAEVFARFGLPAELD
jgi:hypothetical protein